MSVYVDKLPDSCGKCFCNNDDYVCNLTRGKLDYKKRPVGCPLIELDQSTFFGKLEPPPKDKLWINGKDTAVMSRETLIRIWLEDVHISEREGGEKE